MDNCKLCNSPNIVGVEISGIYDGIIMWECQDCNCKIHRFNGKQISSIEEIEPYSVVEFKFTDNTSCINTGNKWK